MIQIANPHNAKYTPESPLLDRDGINIRILVDKVNKYF
jgi:hypothetical protein